MNKTILIAGGASVASLAAGAAGGYFLAKKKFDETVEARIQTEVDATKKHYSLLLMQARDKPAEVPDVEGDDPEIDEEDEGEPDLDNGDLRVVEEDEEPAPLDPHSVAGRAKAAMTDYRKYAGNTTPSADSVETNIFDANGSKKKELPPREPGTGKFLPKKSVQNGGNRHDGVPPEIITHEDFLQNDLEYEQENLTYFINDKTLLGYDPEAPIDIDRVGEVNLTLFPQVPEGEPSIICVRNHGLQIDYEIKLATESLTEYMGLGDNESDFDDDNDEADQAAYL